MLFSHKQRWRRVSVRSRGNDLDLVSFSSGMKHDSGGRQLRRSRSSPEMGSQGHRRRLFFSANTDDKAAGRPTSSTRDPNCLNNDNTSGSMSSNVSDADGNTNTRTRPRRSVSFDDAIRVILVPTRHELKSVTGGRGNGSTDDGGRGSGGGGGVTGGDDGGVAAPGGGGIWWSVQDCLQFRRAFRNQLLGLGLKTLPSILSPDTVTLLAQMDDKEEAERNNDGRQQQRAGQEGSLVGGGDGDAEGDRDPVRGGGSADAAAAATVAAATPDGISKVAETEGAAELAGGGAPESNAASEDETTDRDAQSIGDGGRDDNATSAVTSSTVMVDVVEVGTLIVMVA